MFFCTHFQLPTDSQKLVHPELLLGAQKSPMHLFMTLDDQQRQGDRRDFSILQILQSTRDPDKIVKPWPQTLSPKPLSSKPKTKGPWADTKMFEATTTTTHPLTLEHEGGVPQTNLKSKKVSERSPLRKKNIPGGQ